MFRLDAFDFNDESNFEKAADLWNDACGPDLAITALGVRYCTLPSTGVRQAGRLATVAGQAVGFILASEFSGGDPRVSPRELGWIDALAVAPVYQGRGIGAALLDWAEDWLAGHGCTLFRLGGGLRPLAPGVPAALTVAFFRHKGYDNRATGAIAWDVASDLRGYETPLTVRAALSGQVRTAAPGDETALLAFFEREFPGRWSYEHKEFLGSGGRISDFTVLVTETGIEGFCWLTFEDSSRPLDRFFMVSLPRPWGQLGPIGVSAGLRGSGYGAALLDAGLRRLRDAGVVGCVIDWTNLLDFYGKFGFRPYRRYEMLVKLQA